jgi:hypothetical protein
LPNIGYIEINEQFPTSQTYGWAVNAIDINVQVKNTLGLPVGLRILVGHVDAGINIYQ